MSEAVQRHGFYVQKLFEPVFPGWISESNGHTAEWDIPAEFDRNYGIPTSIKTINLTGSIDCGDARRIWRIDKSYRLIIASYEQQEDYKKIVSIDGYIISPEIINILRGNVSFEIVENFHNTLCSFSREKYKEARVFHKKYKKTLIAEGYESKIKLSPKVGRQDGQRRLQCTIPRKILKELYGDISGDTKYRGKDFGISFYSKKRK